MVRMPGERQSHVAFAGQQLRRKFLLAFAITSILPLLVVTYGALRHLLAGFESTGALTRTGLLVLMLFTVLAVAVGGYIVWDMGRGLATLARALGRSGDVGALARRRDE